jgi:hypothetical protein
MLRSFACSLVAVVLIAGVTVSAEKKDKTVSGSFASYKDGTLTIKLKAKKGEEAKTQEFKVANDVKVTTYAGADKKEGTAKDAFTGVKEGVQITLTLGDGDKVSAVQVGAAPKAKTVGGTFTSYKDGTLIIKVKGKKGDEPKATEFKVADDVKVVTFDGDNKKEGTAKDSFKEVKDGTAITLTLGEGDKISTVQVGTPKKGK